MMLTIEVASLRQPEQTIHQHLVLCAILHGESGIGITSNTGRSDITALVWELNSGQVSEGQHTVAVLWKLAAFCSRCATAPLHKSFGSQGLIPAKTFSLLSLPLHIIFGHDAKNGQLDIMANVQC